MTKVQLEISALVEELFTFRRDTNSLLEAHSALRRGTREEIATAENIFVRDDYKTAAVKHQLPKMSLDKFMRDLEVNPPIFVQNEYQCP